MASTANPESETRMMTPSDPWDQLYYAVAYPNGIWAWETYPVVHAFRDSLARDDFVRNGNPDRDASNYRTVSGPPERVLGRHLVFVMNRYPIRDTVFHEGGA